MYHEIRIKFTGELRALTSAVPCNISAGFLAALKFVNDLHRIAFGDKDVPGEYLHFEAVNLFSERKLEIRELLRSSHEIKATLSSSSEPAIVLKIEFLPEKKGLVSATIDIRFMPLTGTLFDLKFVNNQKP